MSILVGVSNFVRELENQKITYGTIGGLAVFAYGGERTTFDLDLLIDAETR